MPVASIFDTAVGTPFTATYLAIVDSVEDTESMGRVRIRLLNCDGVKNQDAPIWARVAVPFAGGSRGAFFIPDKGDEVVVSFLNGDPRYPVVVGSLWNGQGKTKEKISGGRIDRWTITGRAGTRIAIVEESAAKATISFKTPNGVSGTLTDSDGGKIELKTSSGTVTLDTEGVTVKTTMKVKIDGATGIELKAPQVTVNSMLSNFKGVVKCKVVQTDSVVSKSYTPGVGNVW